MRTHERVVNFALLGLTLAPLFVKVNPNVNVILTACLTVYVGCYLSVKPTPPSETMSNEYAMRFPLVGSAMLLSLFLLFKFFSKDLVNAVPTCYFFVLGIVALSATLLPALKHFLPKHWNDNLIIWRAPYFHSASLEFTRSQVVASVPGTFFCVWYALKKHWLANNILGIAFCIQEAVMSPDSEKWLEAMRSEMDSMCTNQVWTLVDPPEGVKSIGCKWVFKRKTDMEGHTHTYKLGLKSDKCYFVGYPKETMRYYFYIPSQHKVFVAKTGVFLEKDFVSRKTSGSMFDLEEVQDENNSTEALMEDEQEPQRVVGDDVVAQGVVEQQPVQVDLPLRRSDRIRRQH